MKNFNTIALLILVPLIVISFYFSGCEKPPGEEEIIPPVSDPTRIFSKTLGSSLSDLVTGAIQADDGGIVLCGYTIASSFGDNDIFISKLDASGNVVWSNLYGGSGNDQAASIAKTSDGFIIAGHTTSFGTSGFNPFTLKIDNSGAIQWSKYYQWLNEDYAGSIIQTSDDGYIMTGCSNSFTIGGYDVYSLKLDASGDIMWARFYGGSANDFGNAIQETGDLGYIIGGYTYSFGNLGDGYVIKIYGDGAYNWSKTYGGAGLDYIKDIQKSTNGYIACGSTISFGLVNTDAYVLNIDNNGFVYWSRTFGSNGNGESGFSSIRQTSDGGFIAGGSTPSTTTNGMDMCIVRLFGNGEFNYEKIFGGTASDLSSSLSIKNDGGFLLAGSTLSFGAGGNDIYIQSLKSDGTGCSIDNPFTPSAGTPGTEVNDAATTYLGSIPYETVTAVWNTAGFSTVLNTQCILTR